VVVSELNEGVRTN